MSENGAHGTTRPKPGPMNGRRSLPRPASPGSVRIIGGHWRGTRLPVPDRPGLRPSSDRVRETLFNWLQPVLPGARVLDLFAGTGALGLEAVSRGAAHAQLVEADAGLAQALPAVMAADAWLYVESPQDHTPALPAEWALHRENRTRDVRYALYRRATLHAGQAPGDPLTT